MFVRLILSVAMALGLCAGAAQACQCRPVVHHAAYRVAKPACPVCHRARLRHVHRARVHVIERVVHVERHEAWSDSAAYGYAEADQRRWEASRYQLSLRPSPPHPWDTDRAGFLTWSGKYQGYAMQDRYSGQPREYWSEHWQDGRGPPPAPNQP